jgi:hypothetical protein
MPHLIFGLAASTILATSAVKSDEKPQVWPSPDHGLVAKAYNFHEDGRPDLNWDVVTFWDHHGKSIASLSLEEGSGINRAGVVETAWSPDSRFFVFQTTSSSGHSAWHCPAYLFDATTSRIYSIDDSIGAVTDGDKTLQIDAKDTLRISLYNFNNAKDSDPWSLPRTLSLPDFVKTAKIALHSAQH